MIIYIHGFASSGNARKAGETKKYFKNKKVLSPDLPVEPELAFSILKDITRDADFKANLIGSSLGGFYAMLLSAIYGQKAVLVNPAVEAHKSLIKYIGEHTNYDTNEKFLWTQEYVTQLDNLYSEYFKFINQTNLFLLLSKDDELIDHSVTKSAFPNAGKVVEYENCGHQFSRYQEALLEIDRFLYGG
ncbi:MAG: hypothetical protein JW917_01170 [Ignavibacteria bacterium]|nr:hypothetical protein [Ignavibacteria bacterium]